MKKFFTSSKVLVVSGIIAALLRALCYVPYLFKPEYEYVTDFIPELVFAVVIVLLIVAYKKGEINIQKALMGALLFYCAQNTFIGGVYIVEDYLLEYYGDLHFTVFFAILGVLEYVVFFSHIFMQSDHVGNSVLIKINQISCVAVFAIYVLEAIYDTYSFGIRFYSTELLFDISQAFYIIMIVCLETKIQAYKRVRAAALTNGDWNEETKKQARKDFKA